MISPAKYNGINFSYDFTRENETYNFDLQRKINLLKSDDEVKYLSFFVDTEPENDPVLNVWNKNGNIQFVNADSITTLSDGFIYYFKFTPEKSILFYLELVVDSEKIYSEYCICKNSDYFLQNGIYKVVASNNDDRFGYLTKEIFGFFEVSQLKSDFFINKKTEYEGTYGRKTILKSESNIGKRLVFHDLSMYQQNLLKFLCNCQNLTINGKSYCLISDFTEIGSDQNSEIMSLQADFVETEQSFFGDPSSKQPTNIFTSNFFMK